MVRARGPKRAVIRAYALELKRLLKGVWFLRILRLIYGFSLIGASVMEAICKILTLSINDKYV